MHSIPGSNPAAAAYTYSSSCWCSAHPVRRQSEISIEAQPDSRKATAAQQRLLATAAAAKRGHPAGVLLASVLQLSVEAQLYCRPTVAWRQTQLPAELVDWRCP